jgi:PAS domain S-box-containing protein
MLRILLIDDNPQDRVLAIRSIERECPTAQVVEITNAENFSLVLETGQFDLAITDYQLRWTDGLAILNAIKSLYPNCPVIMFTNSGTQEIAIEAMKNGLDDYVIKSVKHYIRLAAAVRSAWEKAQAKRQVIRLENRLQGLLNHLNVGVFRQTLDGTILEGNLAFFHLLGFDNKEINIQNLQLKHFFQAEDYNKMLQKLTKKQQNQECELPLKRADGSLIWVRLNQTINNIDGQSIIDGLIEDIDERKIAEQERKQLLKELESKQKLLEAVLQQMPAGLIIAEAPSGKIILSNDLVESILRGSSPQADQVEDYTNYPYFYLDGRRYAPQELPLARSVRTGEIVNREEVNVLAGDSKLRTLLIDSRPICQSEGTIIAAIVTFFDITERKQTEQALQDALTKLNFHFENTPLAVIERDLDFRITRWSKSAEKIFGWQSEEMIGQNWQAVFSEDLEAVQTIKSRLISGEEKQNISYNRTYTKDGNIVDCEWYDSALFDEAGNFISTLSLVLDVTVRQQAERERLQLLQLEQTARQEAERANRIKDEFLAVLSHELRSPLNPILGWVKILRNRTVDAAMTDRALETIERNAMLQVQLIDDLLDVSRIIQGKTSLTIQPLNLASVIEAAITVIQLSASAKSIQLKYNLAPNVGLISGDANRLQQVVWNLLSNAIKFTPVGGEVSISLDRQDKQAQIQVSDTGKGISGEFLPYVFEYFRQADSSTTRTHGGLGLGLAIVRHLVELHGGTVAADSGGINQGATFTVTLPLLAEYIPGAVLSSKQAELKPEVMLQGLQVLVVDDEQDTRDYYCAVLKSHGAQVTSVASASEALRIIDQDCPDVLLSDIGMPILDGYDLIKQVRAWESDRADQLPAVALTAYARDIDYQEAISSGFQEHLSKPVEPDQLVAVVARLTGAKKNRPT